MGVPRRVLPAGCAGDAVGGPAPGPLAVLCLASAARCGGPDDRSRARLPAGRQRLEGGHAAARRPARVPQRSGPGDLSEAGPRPGRAGGTGGQSPGRRRPFPHRAGRTLGRLRLPAAPARHGGREGAGGFAGLERVPAAVSPVARRRAAARSSRDPAGADVVGLRRGGQFAGAGGGLQGESRGGHHAAGPRQVRAVPAGARRSRGQRREGLVRARAAREPADGDPARPRSRRAFARGGRRVVAPRPPGLDLPRGGTSVEPDARGGGRRRRQPGGDAPRRRLRVRAGGGRSAGRERATPLLCHPEPRLSGTSKARAARGAAVGGARPARADVAPRPDRLCRGAFADAGVRGGGEAMGIAPGAGKRLFRHAGAAALSGRGRLRGGAVARRGQCLDGAGHPRAVRGRLRQVRLAYEPARRGAVQPGEPRAALVGEPALAADDDPRPGPGPRRRGFRSTAGRCRSTRP
jgi:hypothetical protein